MRKPWPSQARGLRRRVGATAALALASVMSFIVAPSRVGSASLRKGRATRGPPSLMFNSPDNFPSARRLRVDDGFELHAVRLHRQDGGGLDRVVLVVEGDQTGNRGEPDLGQGVLDLV